MHVFVTGATGWVGSHTVDELLAAGHTVTGLARSDESAAALAAKGVAVQRGSLEDATSLTAGATAADAVIHTAFNHDFSKFADNAAAETAAIATLGDALAGTNKVLIVTSGIGMIAPGTKITEDSQRDPHLPFPRNPEAAAVALAGRGVRVSIVRLPPSVHGTGDHGFIPIVIGIDKQRGTSAYIGEGANRWPGVHVRDAARLYVKALDKGADYAVYHAVDEQDGVTFRTIAEIIGKQLSIPVTSVAADDAASHFDWFAHFAQMDVPASSEKTRRSLNWEPQEVGLAADVDSAAYFPN